MASWHILVDKKTKRVAIIYLENHGQVKEVAMTDQVARKDSLDDQNLGFRCLLGRTWVRRVVLTTVLRT